MELERKRITIRWKENGHRRVRSRVSGALAIHGTPPWRDSWTVTHVPTGTLIGLFDTEDGALGFMQAISKLVDWSSVQADGSPLTANQRQEIRALRQELGGC